MIQNTTKAKAIILKLSSVRTLVAMDRMPLARQAMRAAVNQYDRAKDGAWPQSEEIEIRNEFEKSKLSIALAQIKIDKTSTNPEVRRRATLLEKNLAPTPEDNS